MPLILTPAQFEAIVYHAVRGRPNEVCGVIGGWEGIAHSVIPIANVAATPRTRYQFDPAQFVTAYHQIERAGGEVIGIYHSHPAGAPIPSVTDIAEATWPDAAYVIVGFPAGDQPQVTAWQLRGGKAESIQFVIVPESSV